MRKRKRGNNEGSITKRTDGRYEARISLGGGDRRSFYGKTREEAARKLAVALRDRDKGIPIQRDGRQTLQAFLTHWLEIVKPRIEASTWLRYRQFLLNHVVPALGRNPLTKLTPQRVQALYAAKLEAGWSPTTVHHLHTVLHTALEQAFKWGLVPYNVTERTAPPRIARREQQVWTPEQANAFLQAARGERLEALYVLALTTGMRVGELLGLQWHDVHFEAAPPTIYINGSLKRTEKGLIIGNTKTTQSERTISMSQVAVAALHMHHARQLQERLRLGDAWDDLELVFANEVGRPIESGNMKRRSFWPIIERAGVPHIRFHDLRHTATTLMLMQGERPEVVAKVLGHASPVLTLDRYNHILPGVQHGAAAAMDRLFLETWTNLHQQQERTK